MSFGDNFDDNAINSNLWREIELRGPTVDEANGRVEVTFPAAAAGEIFTAGYDSKCRLVGDFDTQIDYELLSWPAKNGVRLGLIMNTGLISQGVVRVSFASTEGTPGEFYTSDGGNVPTTDLRGRLRLTRLGSTISAFRDLTPLNPTPTWSPLYSGSGSTDDALITFNGWSGDSAFVRQDVKFAFDNFRLNSGNMVCMVADAVPLRARIGDHDSGEVGHACVTDPGSDSDVVLEPNTDPIGRLGVGRSTANANRTPGAGTASATVTLTDLDLLDGLITAEEIHGEVGVTYRPMAQSSATSEGSTFHGLEIRGVGSFGETNNIPPNTPVPIPGVGLLTLREETRHDSGGAAIGLDLVMVHFRSISGDIDIKVGSSFAVAGWAPELMNSHCAA